MSASHNTIHLHLRMVYDDDMIIYDPPEGGDFEDLALSGPYGLSKLKTPG